jgi:hypothetical protein
MELDIYIPSFELAFEYQGIQHYEDDDPMFAENAGEYLSIGLN